jgi:hypothetical protein
VIVVFLENQPQSAVLAQGPYERQLSQQYASATRYYGVCHPSAANYLSATSGNSWQCGSDAYTTYNTANLADLLTAQGLSWMGYFESIPSPCYTAGDTTLYVRHHNPWIYYSDIVGNASLCNSHVVGFPPLWSAVNSSNFPNFAWITPNQKDDGHDTGVAGADKWLANWLPSVQAQPWYTHTAIFVTYDESVKSDTSGYRGLNGGHIYFTAVSPFTKGISNFTQNSTHFSLLSTIEWLFGLGSTGHNDSTANFPAMKSLFNFPPPNYSLSGTIRTTSGLPITGATVSAQGPVTATMITNSTGSYAFSLPNGTYTVSASAPGFVTNSTVRMISGSSILGVDITLRVSTAATFLLTGRITAAQTGAPIPGSVLYANGSSGHYSTIASGSGNYSFALTNGTYEVSSTAKGFLSAFQNITVAGVTVSNVNFALAFSSSAARFSLGGTVIAYPTGAPVSGATVYANGTSGDFSNQSLATGAFMLQLQNGSFLLTVIANSFHSYATNVTIRGSPPALLGIELFPLSLPVYSLQLIVQNALNNVPVTGAFVEIRTGSTADDAFTGTDGTLTVALPNGTDRVTAAAAGFRTGTENVTISGKPLTGVVLALQPSTSPPAPGSSGLSSLQIEGLVALTAGIAVAVGVLVARHRQRSATNRKTRSSADAENPPQSPSR